MVSDDATLSQDVEETLISRLEESPVRLALLFGSYETGEATSASDVDIAVEYESDVTEVTDVHLSLVADLMRILGRDDIDVVRLTAVDPRIAVEALDYGRMLVGTSDEVDRLCAQLEENREQREDTVRARISDAECAIERRLEQREHG
jgi:predicted nucleotidyltransferase